MTDNTTSPMQAILVLSPTGTIIYASDDALKLTGYDESLLKTLSFESLRHADMPEGPFRDLWKTVSNSKPWMGILELSDAEGNSLWCDTYVVPLNDRGEVLEYHCILRPPSQQICERAANIYKLRASGKMPVALRLPNPNLTTRLTLSTLVSTALGLGVYWLAPEQGWAALPFAALLSITGSSLLTASHRKLVNASQKIVTHPIKQLIYTGTRDDVGQLQLCMQMQQTQIEAIMQRVQNAADEMLNKASYAVQLMQRTCSEIEEQQQAAGEISSAMEQMSQTLLSVSRNSGQTSEAADSASLSAEQGRAIIAESVLAINRLADSISTTTAIVERLEQQSNNIGNIVGVIQAVSEQTNLLALNAAIEAARAGEDGRGFAVVADEVRQLALRTRGATDEIHTMISTLQTETSQIVEAMNAKRQLSEQSVEQVKRAGQSLEQISSGIAEITSLAALTAETSREQQQVTSEVSRLMQQLNSLAEQTVNDASTTLELNDSAVKVARGQRQMIACITQA